MELDKKNIIIDLYYSKHIKVKEIADIVKVDKSYVSRIIHKDLRYKEEKDTRKKESKIRHIEKTKKRIKENRETIKFKNSADDLILKNIHRQDSLELSKSSHLSNESYRKWNYSAYKYNPSKRRYEFREELGRSYDVPKYIKERK